MLLINDNVALVRSSTRIGARRMKHVAPSVRPAEPHAPAAAAPGLRHVALLVETTGAYGRGLIQGIAKYNREHGNWSTYFRPHALNDAPPAWLRNWKGDGMLVRIETQEMYDLVRRCGVPAVNLRGTIKGLPLPYVSMDNRQIAQLALTHLRDRGIRNFAVCGRDMTPAMVSVLAIATALTSLLSEKNQATKK